MADDLLPEDVAAAATIVGVVARQLSELAEAISDDNGGAEQALRLKLATTAPLAAHALGALGFGGES